MIDLLDFKDAIIEYVAKQKMYSKCEYCAYSTNLNDMSYKMNGFSMRKDVSLLRGEYTPIICQNFEKLPKSFIRSVDPEKEISDLENYIRNKQEI